MKVRKETRDRAIELLKFFEKQSLVNWTNRDAIETVLEVLRDGCIGWVNKSDEDLLEELTHNLLSDEDLDGEKEEVLERHAELRETISAMQADIAIANIIGG